MNDLSDAEAVKFLNDIDAGIITLYTPIDPQAVYAGNLTYLASNGWSLTLFNDCNEWDYIDTIASNDGRVFSYGDPEAQETWNWKPNDATLWHIWGIPGYLNHRYDVWHGCNPTPEMIKLHELEDRIQVTLRCFGSVTYDWKKYYENGLRPPDEPDWFDKDGCASLIESNLKELDEAFTKQKLLQKIVFEQQEKRWKEFEKQLPPDRLR